MARPLVPDLAAKTGGRVLYTPSLVQVLMLPGIVGRQWWSPRQLRKWQDERLVRLVKHAYAKVPFYRRTWADAGVSPADVRSLDDLARLPVIPGRDLKSAAPGEIIAGGIDPGRCRVERTSGSTGVPLTVAYTRSDHYQVMKAMSVRHYRAHGVRVRDRLASFSPSPPPRSSRAWYEAMGFWRRLVLDSRRNAGEWLEPLRRMEPDVIAGSPMSLRELVMEIEAVGTPLRPPRVIFSSGARLESGLRGRIEATLGAPVHDAYGSYESGFLAWECPRCDGYHLNVDTVIVEVLKDGVAVEPGGTGEVVITNLFSSAMPFIRYNLGDVVTLSAKTPVCGRSLPLIEQVWGRNDDVVRLPSGREVGAYPVYMCLLGVPFIREWMLVQDAGGECTLRLVLTEPVGQEALDEVRSAMEMALSGEVTVHLDVVEEIRRDSKAKFKTIVSHVPAGS